MNVSFRRYEILLPRRFNDDHTVLTELIADTLLELEEHCRAVSSETDPLADCGDVRISFSVMS